MRGFMRIIEVIIVLTLMFSLMSGLVSQAPSAIVPPANIELLNRWAFDMATMVCNSEQDRALIFSSQIEPINASLNYVSPPDMSYRILVMDGANVVQSAGGDPGEAQDIGSAGCVITNQSSALKVVVQTWY